MIEFHLTPEEYYGKSKTIDRRKETNMNDKENLIDSLIKIAEETSNKIKYSLTLNSYKMKDENCVDYKLLVILAEYCKTKNDWYGWLTDTKAMERVIDKYCEKNKDSIKRELKPLIDDISERINYLCKRIEEIKEISKGN